MPGTLVIDPATFTSQTLMAIEPKPVFERPGEQSTNKAGTPQWVCQVAVTYAAEPGMRTVAEVLPVTITAPTDPALNCQPGPCILDGLRAGISPPETTDRGRIRGGKLWWTATGIHAANGHRPAGKAD